MFKLFYFFLITIFITSCSIKNHDKNIYEQKNNNKIINTPKVEEGRPDFISIRAACGSNEIDKYLEKGWTILSKEQKDIVCTWKSIPQNKTCNIEKDKGCKITVPNKIGKETIYNLVKPKS